MCLQTECFLDTGFDDHLVNNARRWMVNSIIVPILESAPVPMVDKYFQKYAQRIFDMIAKYPNGPERTKTRSLQLPIQAMELECAYKVLSLQYERLHKNSVISIGLQYKNVIKQAKSHVLKCGKQDNIHLDFLSAAYNCLSRCIMCTQIAGSLNTWTLLFIEKPKKKEMLWSNIIDLNQEFVFSIDTNFNYYVRRVRRMMQQTARDLGIRNIDVSHSEGFLSQNVRNNSSLKRDATDISSLSQQFYSFQPGNHQQNNEVTIDDIKDGEEAAAGNENFEKKEEFDDDDDMHLDEEQKKVDIIDEKENILELDSINSMPVMNTMLHILDKLQKYFSDEWKYAQVPPKWMNSIRIKMSAVNSHVNIKWFIAKLIINRPQVFEKFAGDFFKPLVELCLIQNFQNWGFHYFLRDICELFLFKWKRFIPDTKFNQHAQKFIEHLIEMVTDFGNGTSKNAKSRQNVHYITLLLAKWKGIPTVSKRTLFPLLSMDDKYMAHMKKKSLYGLEVNDRLLIYYHHKIVPCTITKKYSAKSSIRYRVLLPGNQEIEDVRPNMIRKRSLRLEKKTALYVLDALAETDFSVFDLKLDAANADGITPEKFVDAFCSGFRSKSTPIWKTSAKVYGDILRKEEENKLKNNFCVILSTNLCVRKVTQIIKQCVGSDLPKAIEILNRIGNEHPSFLTNELMLPFLHSCGKVHIKFLTDCIRLLAMYVSVESQKPDPEVAVCLRPGLERIFKHNDVNCHLALCDVFLRLLPYIDYAEKRDFLPLFIENFAEHESHLVRRKLLGILSHVYDNDNTLLPDLKKQVRDCLLAALSDSNKTNRRLMFDFWGHSERLQSTIVERMEDLFTKMFSPVCESLWLHYSTFLLLQPMRKSTDFKQLLSRRPLSECEFSEMNVNSRWLASNNNTQPMLTPMFANHTPSQTLATFHDSDFGLFNRFGGQSRNMIRATQQNFWSQTQAIQFSNRNKLIDHLPKPNEIPAKNMKASFAWSYASSQMVDLNDNTSNNQKLESSSGISSADLGDLYQGSFAPFRSLVNNKNKKLIKSESKSAIHTKIVAPISSQRFSSQMSQQRIGDTIRFFDRKKRYHKAWEAKQRETQAHAVSLFRRYRDGELPDICIPHSDLQLPLQALHTDPIIAKQLFLMLFEAIYHEACDRSDRHNHYDKRIENALCAVIKQCECNSSLVSTLLLAATKMNQLPIHPKYIADLAIRSNNLYAGVVILEDMLEKGEIQNISDEPPEKRRKIKSEQKMNNDGSEDLLSFDERIFSQLSRLYNELHEQDTVLALSRKFATMQLTKDGVQCFMKGDYSSAYECYQSAIAAAELQQDRCQVSRLEKSLWKEESIKCLHKLAKWDQILDNTKIKLKFDLENVWTFQSKLNDDILQLNLDSNDNSQQWMSISQKQQQIQTWLYDWMVSASKNEQEWQPLLLKIDEWVSSTHSSPNIKGEYMEEHFSPLLAFLYCQRNDFARSKFYLRKSYDNFLKRWCNLPKFAFRTKKAMLCELQKLTEIKEFTAVMRYETEVHGRRNENEMNIEDMLQKYWKHRYPQTGDDILVWDNIIFYRKAFGRKINELPDFDHVRPLVTELLVDTLYHGIESMISQQNFVVGSFYRQDAGLLGSLNPKFKVQHIELKLQQLLKSDKSDSKQKIQSLQQLNDILHKYLSDRTMFDFSKDLFTLQGTVLNLMGDIIEDNNALSRYTNNQSCDEYFYNSELFFKKALSTFNEDDDEDEDIELKNDEDEELEYAVDGDINGNSVSVDDVHNDNNADINQLILTEEENHANAHMQLALFCNQRLVSIEKQMMTAVDAEQRAKIKKRTYSKNEIEFGEIFIENTMKAMMLNSNSAISRFPRILEISVMHPSLQVLIIRLSKHIPCWMFLRWISQMLAQLGSISAIGYVVFPILQRIARMYPKALIYPFNLTAEDLKYDENAQLYINQLRNILRELPSYELIQMFTKSLEGLLHPNLRFNDIFKDIRNLFTNKKTAKLKETKIKAYQMLETMKEDLFTLHKKYIGNKIGNENVRFYKCYHKLFESKFGKNFKYADGEKFSIKEILKHLAKIKTYKNENNETMDVSFGRRGGKFPLSDYSTWLSDFNCNNFDELLEIPGQYSGMQRPVLSTYLYIISFDPSVLIMSSLRKPKRIKIRTNDEKEQLWLVKGGEDLRLDQRIEQLFNIINNILISSTECSKRNLVLRTYKVIPLTRSVGIIEWIVNTIPIKGLICKHLKKHQQKCLQWNQITTFHANNFMKINKGKMHSASIYVSAILKYSSMGRILVKSLHKSQELISADCLQRCIKDMARDAEAYIQLRCRFLSTLSVYTLCGYILGIGDRHLDNYLVDQNTGQVIGIDFGAAFGYGLALPVPELIPLRLTRQFCNIMAPLDTVVHFRNNAVHTMRALQNSRETLLNVMDVFVKEPSCMLYLFVVYVCFYVCLTVDWVDMAHKTFEKSNAKQLQVQQAKEDAALAEISLSSSVSSSSSSGTSVAALNPDISWYPRHKIEIARLKLSMFKSTYVMIQEIQSTPHYMKTEMRNAMEKIIDGRWSMRTKFNDKCDSVEDQIDSLIEHAMDDNLLAVTWQGWGPWA